MDDLLDVSRITHGRIEIRREPLDVAQLVRQAAEDARASVEQAKATLQQAEAGLNAAKANLEQANANQEISRLSYTRWDRLVSRGVVSKQAADERRTDFSANGVREVWKISVGVSPGDPEGTGGAVGGCLELGAGFSSEETLTIWFLGTTSTVKPRSSTT